MQARKRAKLSRNKNRIFEEEKSNSFQIRSSKILGKFELHGSGRRWLACMVYEK